MPDSYAVLNDSIFIYLSVDCEIPASFITKSSLEPALKLSLAKALDFFSIDYKNAVIELSVNLLGDSAIQKLNCKFRGKDVSTDILSFPIIESLDDLKTIPPGSPPVSLGDLVISLETIEKQALECGITIRKRFAECLVHGILHLLGFEHSSDEGKENMENAEDALIDAITDILDNPDGD